MARITWSPTALRNLWAIHDYVAEDSVFQAGRLIKRILARPQTLAKHPFAGRQLPSADNPNIREVFEGRYRIIYRIRDDGDIDIARVVHSAQNFQPEDL